MRRRVALLGAAGTLAALLISAIGVRSAAGADPGSWLASRYQIGVDFGSIPRESAQVTACTFAAAAGEYPDVAAGVRWIGSLQRFTTRFHVDGSFGHVWAYATSSEDARSLDADPAILLDAASFRRPDEFARRVAASIARGLHPPGHEGIQGTVLHEFGHHVWWTLQRFPGAEAAMRATVGRVLGRPVDFRAPIRGAVRAKVAVGLSRFAAINWDEFMAEAFVEWHRAGAPRPVAAAVGRVADQFLKRSTTGAGARPGWCAGRA